MHMNHLESLTISILFVLLLSAFAAQGCGGGDETAALPDWTRLEDTVDIPDSLRPGDGAGDKQDALETATGQDAKADAADIQGTGPCHALTNPQCTSLPCDDGDPATIFDMCVLINPDECMCIGVKPEHHACGETSNPQCNPHLCNDMNPATIDDHCVYEDGGCVCEGVGVFDDPCGDLMNPECKPYECDDGNPETNYSVCLTTTEGCLCAGFVIPVGACGPSNLQCSPEPCDDGDPATVNDHCVLHEGVASYPGGQEIDLCLCEGEDPPLYPCTESANPQCSPEPCDDGNPATIDDKCKFTSIDDVQSDEEIDAEGWCACQGTPVPTDSCSDYLNPSCVSADCDDGNPQTVDDKCVLVELVIQGPGEPGGQNVTECLCQGAPMPVDPCGTPLNPQCHPVACDDGNPNTMNDVCQLADDIPMPLDEEPLPDAPLPFNGCICKGQPVPPADPCGSYANPQCSPAACDDGNPDTVNDHCKIISWLYDTEEGPDMRDMGPDAFPVEFCICEGDPIPEDPCGDEPNPQCSPEACNDGNPFTHSDRCIFKTLTPQDPYQTPDYREPDPADAPWPVPVELGCVCEGLDTDQDPCGQDLNPACGDVPCDDNDPLTKNDRCQFVLVEVNEDVALFECGCKGDPISTDPCSSILNPQCSPETCDDDDQNTINDRCQWFDPFVQPIDVDDPVRASLGPYCACQGDAQPPPDPCGSYLNAQCTPEVCDDQNPNTINDKCKLVEFIMVPFGGEAGEVVPGCICQGDPMNTDPCGSYFNPACIDQPCNDDNADTIDDRCKLVDLPQSAMPGDRFDAVEIWCACQGKPKNPDPCGGFLNPACTPAGCDDDNSDTVNDKCVLQGGKCLCIGEPPGPCSNMANPQCTPVPCNDGNSLTTGDHCQYVEDDFILMGEDLFIPSPYIGQCACKGVPPGPCDDAANPQCSTVPCDDSDPTTVNDTCQDIGGLCVCQGEPGNPCGTAVNPQCSPDPCDDGDPDTVEDTCAVISGNGCSCLGKNPDPCGFDLNPNCSPVSCDNEEPGGAYCKYEQGQCVCNSPCGESMNPQCAANACDDGDAGTLYDRCITDLSTGLCTCKGISKHADIKLKNVTLQSGTSLSWSFVILADPHANQSNLDDTIDWVNKHKSSDKIEFLIVLGDVTSGGNCEHYPKIKQKLDTYLDVPYLPLVGNHDIVWKEWPWSGEWKGCREEFQQIFLPHIQNTLATHFPAAYTIASGGEYYFTNYAFTHKGWHFIALDFCTRDTGISGYAGSGDLFNWNGGTLNWFKNHIAYFTNTYTIPKDHIVLLSHHPMVPPFPILPGSVVQELVQILAILLETMGAFSPLEYAVMCTKLNPYQNDIGHWFSGHFHISAHWPIKCPDMCGPCPFCVPCIRDICPHDTLPPVDGFSMPGCGTNWLTLVKIRTSSSDPGGNEYIGVCKGSGCKNNGSDCSYPSCPPGTVKVDTYKKKLDCTGFGVGGGYTKWGCFVDNCACVPFLNVWNRGCWSKCEYQ